MKNVFFSDYLIGYLFDNLFIRVQMGKIIFKEAYFLFICISTFHEISEYETSSLQTTAVQRTQKIKIKLDCTFRKYFICVILYANIIKLGKII